MARTSHLNELVRSCKSFPDVSNMPTLAYSRMISIIIKKTTAIILNIIHNIFNLRDTEVVVHVCINITKQFYDREQMSSTTIYISNKYTDKCIYNIYKSEVYTYNSQVGLNKTAIYEYHICIYKNYIQVNLQRMLQLHLQNNQ